MGSGLNHGLVGASSGTQSVCLQQDCGSNRTEKWLSRFLVPDQLETVWGRLRRPEAS